METLITLKRNIFTDKSTIGVLNLGDQTWFSLEDKDRELKQSDPLDLIKVVKIKEKTAIPIGKYEVITSFSNRFKKVMPLLLEVPAFEGVRIHSGNTSENTEGCILLGKSQTKDFIGESRQAILEFMNTLNHKLELGKVFIQITK